MPVDTGAGYHYTKEECRITGNTKKLKELEDAELKRFKMIAINCPSRIDICKLTKEECKIDFCPLWYWRNK